MIPSEQWPQDLDQARVHFDVEINALPHDHSVELPRFVVSKSETMLGELELNSESEMPLSWRANHRVAGDAYADSAVEAVRWLFGRHVEFPPRYMFEFTVHVKLDR